MPPRTVPALPRWTDDPASVRPMLATPLTAGPDAVLGSSRHVFERKLDGMRVLAHAEPGHPLATVRLFSRNGHDKTRQFPEVVRELQRFVQDLGVAVLLDGEVVALDARGQPTSFVDLAERLHERDAREYLPEGRRGARGLRRLRPAARGRGRPPRLAAHRSQGSPREGVPHARLRAAPRERLLGRRRATLARSRDRRALGGPGRERRRLTLRHRQAQPGVAEDQDPPRAGIRCRGLDAAAGHAGALRLAGRRVLRAGGDQSRVEGGRVRGIRLCGPRPGSPARRAAQAGHRDVPLRSRARDHGARALGAARAGRPGAIHRVDP